MTRAELTAGRPGFSLLELLVVLTLMAILATITVPSFSRSLAQLRLRQAASVVVSNLQLARSVAARQRSPVRLSIDTVAEIIRVRNYTNDAKVYAEQRLNADADNGVQQLTVTDTSVVIYPGGLVEKQLDIVLWTSGNSRRVRMTRAGQIRILP